MKVLYAGQVKRLRDAAMATLDSSYYDTPYGSINEDEQAQKQRVAQQQAEPYLSLLELITEVYQVEFIYSLTVSICLF